MYLPFVLACVGAAGVSAVALTDALTVGLTGVSSVFTDVSGQSAAQLVASLVHGLMYASIAWLLHDVADRIDAGSRVRRALRRLIGAVFATFAVLFGVVEPVLWAQGTTEPPSWLAAVEGPTTLMFVGGFVLAFALGMGLRRVPQMRPASTLLIAVGPVLVVTVLLAAAGEPLARFAHPAYAEIAINVGLALTGLSTARAHRQATSGAPLATSGAPAGV